MALQSRPPVVTIMGHVDHGKTSLLDYIRQAHVASGEAGGITQHIGAYQAEFQGKKLTFIDTPGHAAFSKMRSRGASVTDLAVLVVAADDGVMPQTVESIKHIQSAGVPMIVAINKMDLQDAQPDKVKGQLTEHGVYVSGYGGDIDVVPLSAKTGEGVDALLETLVTMGELMELQADADAPAVGVVIESSKDRSRGTLATVLVQQGTFHKRDPLFADNATGAIRTMQTATGQAIETAPPSTPVEVTGFTDVPPVGSVVQTVALEEKEVVAKPVEYDFSALLGETSNKLRMILKADVAGSLEAIQANLDSDKFEIINSGVGDITESEIQLAETSKSVIIGFNVKYSGALKKLAERQKVKVRTYKIIYELFEALDLFLRRLNEPDMLEKVTGQAKVLKVFNIRGEIILGSRITSGAIRKNELIKVMRGEELVYDGKVKGIKQGKVEVDSMSEGDECGVVIWTKTAQTPQEGDTLVVYNLVENDL
jgi:translation initiation factor IF-2